ncbi:MAG: hypothetical protein K5739_07670 [Lachnospiraceae bacterium]|nr:hypothetical protein [Lachnospiraceae bacterium]
MKTERLGNLEHFLEAPGVRGRYVHLTGMPTIQELRDMLLDLPTGAMLVLYWNNPYSVHAICNGSFGISTDDSTSLSRKEFDETIRYLQAQSGQFATLAAKWFYPYPTVEFPVAVFSDSHLPGRGECDDNLYNFQDTALELFDEATVVDNLIGTGQYPAFAHAYMLVLTMDGLQSIEYLPDYTRFSNERREELKVRTDVYPNKVYKAAFSYQAKDHILKLPELGKKLEQTITGLSVLGKPISVNHLKNLDRDRGVAVFEYVDGDSLEHALDRMVGRGEGAACAKLIQNFVTRMRSLPGLIPFETGYEFRLWFGDPPLDKLRTLDENGNETTVMALPVADIDMIPQNILLRDEDAVLIDYEWTFDFPVPVDYVIFRFLYYYLEGKHRTLYKRPELMDVYRTAGFTEEAIRYYTIMETHFQEYVQQSAMVLRNEYEMFGKPLIRRWEIQSMLLSAGGHGITVRYPSQHEEVISSLPTDPADQIPGQSRQEVYHYKIPVTENGEMILYLPAVRLLRIGILSVMGGRSREQEFLVNGDVLAGCVYSFETAEPKISVDVSTNQTGYLMLSLEEIPVSRDAFSEISTAITDYKFLAENRDKQLEALKASTSWKLTKPLRALKKDKE